MSNLWLHMKKKKVSIQNHIDCVKTLHAHSRCCWRWPFWTLLSRIKTDRLINTANMQSMAIWETGRSGNIPPIHCCLKHTNCTHTDCINDPPAPVQKSAYLHVTCVASLCVGLIWKQGPKCFMDNSHQCLCVRWLPFSVIVHLLYKLTIWAHISC